MQFESLRRTDHRPWPLPEGPWRWRQSWRDLLFAHWPIPATRLRHLVPPRLSIQEFDGTSWVGVVPFRMTGVMLRPFPDLPWVSAFPELNLRLYVEAGGKPGIWFVSLDAANPLAVWVARRMFHLPYFHAAMTVRTEGDRIHYSSVRRSGHARVAFRGVYWPRSEAREARSGTIEHFLAERYCLYVQSPDGTLLRGNIHHAPWRLQRAEAELEENNIAGPQGIAIEGPPALLHCSKRIDAVVWDLERVYP